jgi:hypothetical protein
MSDTFLTDILKERLQSKVEPIPGVPSSVAHALVDKVLLAAERGNVAAMSLIWDRVEGPPYIVYDDEEPLIDRLAKARPELVESTS